LPDDRAGPPLEEELALLMEAVEPAAALAHGYFRQPLKTWYKAGHSPVSEADMAVDALLKQRLGGARASYGWLSEETADSDERLGRTRIIVVDPIDGTRAFIAGEPHWAVSAAIVEDGRPLVAVLSAPAQGELYAAMRGRGAWLNGEPIAVTEVADTASARLASPRHLVHQAKGLKGINPAHVARVPSLALRLAMVAAGRFDAALASGNSADWDLAAADLLVHEAGGRLTGLDGRTLRYNRPEPRHPSLVAANPRLHGRFLEALGGRRPDAHRDHEARNAG
jgi:myo-inositol-1(or 4)-monophosphatase